MNKHIHTRFMRSLLNGMVLFVLPNTSLSLQLMCIVVIFNSVFCTFCKILQYCDENDLDLLVN